MPKRLETRPQAGDFLTKEDCQMLDRKISWLVINSLWLVCVIAATFYGVAGAYYVAVFIVGLTVFTGVMSIFNPSVVDPTYAFNVYTEFTFDLFISCLFVLAGMFWLGGLYFVFNLVLSGVKENKTLAQ